MSNRFKNPFKFDYLTSKKPEFFFNSDNEDDSCDDFSCSPGDEGNSVKKVDRQRMNEDEKNVWGYFDNNHDAAKSDRNLNAFDSLMHPSRQTLRKTYDDVNLDVNLRRLEKDMYPEEAEITIKPKKNISRIDFNLIKDNHNDNDDDNSSDKRSGDTFTIVNKSYDDSIIYERSPLSKLDLKTKSSKSRSKNTTKRHPRHQHLKSCIFGDNCREYKSNPELTTTRKDKDYDRRYCSSEIRPHSEVTLKILGIQSRISELLDEIYYRLCRIPVPDGEIDLKRRQQRVMEFVIRFSRNYLYDLSRQMADIQRHVQIISPSVRFKPSKRVISLHAQALENKLCSVHQLLFNALCAYCKHIPSSCLNGHPGKLKEILQIVIDLKNICSEINLTAEYFGTGDTPPPPLGDDIEQRCDAILGKLYANSERASVYSYTVPSTLRSSLVDNRKRKKQIDNRKKTTNRFNMYREDYKFQKKRPVTVGFCMKTSKPNRGRQKLTNPPSTAVTEVPSTFKHNKVPVKHSQVKTKKIQKEEEIKTMMEIMPSDSERESSALLSKSRHSSVLNINDKLLKKKICQSNNESRPTTKSSKKSISNTCDEENVCGSSNGIITNQEFLNFLPIIADILSLIAERQKKAPLNVNEMTMETLLQILQEYVSDKNKDTNEALIDSPRQQNFRQSEIILNHHEESILISKCGKSNDAKNSKDSSDTTKDDKKRKLTALIVSQDAIDEFVHDYRNKINEAAQSSSRNENNSSNKPDEAAGRMTDKLSDEVIEKIAKGMEIDNIIQKLFDLEFQEY